MLYRKKHLRCDGGLPTCARCLKLGFGCKYTPSRRGYKGPSKKRRISRSQDGEESHALSDEHHHVSQEGVADSHVNDWQVQFAALVALPEPFDAFNVLQSPSEPRQEALWLPKSNFTASSCGCIESYYKNFHAAHPILISLHLTDLYCPTDIQSICCTASHWSSLSFRSSMRHS